MTQAPYRPAWWLPGAHLRTLWGKLFRRTPHVSTRLERWDTPDGDFLDIHRLEAQPRSPRLLILHGLEGSRRSHYVAGLLDQARRRGWAADLVVWRSCGDELNRAPRFYHSGETTDLDLVVRRLIDTEPGAPLIVAGFSLGGNVLLKWLGERGEDLPAEVRAAAAISVPFDLAQGARHIERGFSRVYGTHFLRSLRRKALAKRQLFPELIRAEALAAARTLWDFDDCVTAPVHGFRNAADYYARSSSLNFLARIRCPTLLLSARDDPFLPPAVLDDVRAIAARNAALSVEFVEKGGHVGFIGGAVPWRPVYYAEWRVAEWLGRALEN
ncbi:MAG: hydrolase [Gemmatimonadota bacterium]|nr:hydrolase [Gemmatimonadota bacterium]